ncbi:MAG: NAD(P)-dependent alcohol dehydrogenase [Deinococcota bacterium]
MKAFVNTVYGPPDVLKFKDVARPQPQANEVLVKIHAASINPWDWHNMRGEPFPVRFSNGMLKPTYGTLGADIAGVVEAVGSEVSQFKVGDGVFGDINFGGFAEYACSPEANITHKPNNISFEEAAAVPIAGLTALQGLRDHAKVKAGQHVLINGAAGGVGSYAVQLAKVFGAEVTGVCSTPKLEYVRSLGADHVIDYTKTDYSRTSKHYDVILDAVGNGSNAGYKRALSLDGTAVVLGMTSLVHMLTEVVVFGSITSKTSKRRISVMMAQIKQDDLAYLAELLEQGSIKSKIDRCYPLRDTPKAIAYLEEKHATGKVIIQVA